MTVLRSECQATQESKESLRTTRSPLKHPVLCPGCLRRAPPSSSRYLVARLWGHLVDLDGRTCRSPKDRVRRKHGTGRQDYVESTILV